MTDALHEGGVRSSIIALRFSIPTCMCNNYSAAHCDFTELLESAAYNKKEKSEQLYIAPDRLPEGIYVRRTEKK